MSPVLTRSRPASVGAPRAVIAVGSAAIVAIVALLGLFELVRGPEFVDHVTIDNRAPADERVDLLGPDGAVIALGVVDAHSRARIEEVVDPGDPWVFRVSRAGRTLGVIRTSRGELAANGWRVVVPASLEDEASPRQ